MVSKSIVRFTLFTAATLQQASASICGSYATCSREVTFYTSVTLKRELLCPSERYAYVSSISIDSPQGGSFTYRVYENETSPFFYVNCSQDSSSLCYVIDTRGCAKSAEGDAVVTIYCSNWLAPCTIRYGVEFGCTSILTTFFSSSSASHTDPSSGFGLLLATASVVAFGASMLLTNGVL